MIASMCRRLASKIVGSDKTYRPTATHDRKQRREAKKRSKQLDQALRADWKYERSRIKLLLLGPGEAGKSTLIKQMQLIHGENMECQEKLDKIPYIRQNVFDSMVAILVAMQTMGIPLADPRLQGIADEVLNHSQVNDPTLTPKDILNSEYLGSTAVIDHVQALWNDNGVHKAYSRSNEYQLLDCAAYFFDRLDDIRCADYIPSEQDVLRCRVMTTSITETKFTVPYSGQRVNFKVLDVGGQQGERRKWITLFDEVTAVLFMMDASSFDQSLREDSQTNRLLESLKVFYQTITTRYLRSVSILTFMNKIDKLREKVEKGDDFSAAIDRVRKQAAELSQSADVKSDFERGLYSHIHQILVENPYSTFIPTDRERRTVIDAFSTFARQQAKSEYINHNQPSTFTQTVSSPSLARKLVSKRSKKSFDATPDLHWKVIKAAAYINLILLEIVETVRTNSRSCSFQSTVDMSMNTGYRSYEFCYTCAVDKTNIKRVIDGTKNIIIRDYFSKMGISLD